MNKLAKFVASGMFAHGIIFASYAGAAGWGTTPTGAAKPNGVPDDLTKAVMNITNWILGFVVLIATLMIIFGGVMYLTSAGSEDAIEKAKKTIMYGIVGVIVCGLAYAMVTVVSTIIGGGTAGTAA